jgi:hypothetical protein
VDRVQQLAVKECDLNLVDVIVPMNAAGLRIVAGRSSLGYVSQSPISSSSGRCLSSAPRRLPTIDEVLYTGFLGGIGPSSALLRLALCSDRPEILDAPDAVHPRKARARRTGVLQVSCHDLDTLTSQFTAGGAAGLSRELLQLPATGITAPLWRPVALRASSPGTLS